MSFTPKKNTESESFPLKHSSLSNLSLVMNCCSKSVDLQIIFDASVSVVAFKPQVGFICLEGLYPDESAQLNQVNYFVCVWCELVPG